jgi:arylsulfatase A-like enzyme
MEKLRDDRNPAMSTILLLAAVLAVALLLTLCNKGGHGATPSAAEEQKRYNFVVVITDDQRWDTLWAMPIVTDKLAKRGVVFNNAFVSNPLCAPSRASLLSGGFYSHRTGVLMNQPPSGGVKRFNDRNTLATELQRTGYKTALVGKYINGYPSLAPYVPPGWTKFVGLTKNNFYNFRVCEGGSGLTPSRGKFVEINNQYQTDFLTDRALDFLDRTGDTPFFLYFSPYAPHAPATPARSDDHLFSDFRYRKRAYGQLHLTAKSQVFRNALAKSFNKKSIKHFDKFTRNQLRSLQAVDRAVGRIVDKIEKLGKTSRTVFFFTSDNGFMWGEHGLFRKAKPYEESIRVPLVVTMPGIQPRRDDHLVVAPLDIGPTILDLARIQKPTDGMSLRKLMQDPSVSWREEFVIESFDEEELGPWIGLRTRAGKGEWKYIEYADGFKELYDLVSDPFEEKNRSNDPAYQAIAEGFSRKLEKSRSKIPQSRDAR